MTTADLRGLTDEGLTALLNDTLNEQERRQRLARAPEQVAALAAQFVADGGDKAALTEAVAAAEPPPA